MKGTVKFYNWKKRYGFITGEDGQDYFVHMTGIVPGNKLFPGDQVEFEVENGDKGPKAVNVKKTNNE